MLCGAVLCMLACWGVSSLKRGSAPDTAPLLLLTHKPLWAAAGSKPADAPGQPPASRGWYCVEPCTALTVASGERAGSACECRTVQAVHIITCEHAWLVHQSSSRNCSCCIRRGSESVLAHLSTSEVRWVCIMLLMLHLHTMVCEGLLHRPGLHMRNTQWRHG